MTTLRGGAATDVGRVRQMNEDRYLVTDRVFAVADGVGGHQAGEVAAQTSVETLESSFTEPTTEGLVDAVLEANRAVWQLAQGNSEKRGMGTTMAAVALVEDDGEEQLAVVNVGDSRVYLFQRDELVQLSEDHSLVEELVRDGRLTREEAQVHPQRSIITRALGMEPEVEVDSWLVVPYAGDRLLLCSDGLTNELSDERIASTLRRLDDPDDAARELVRQARANGGSDNITVVVIDVVDDDDRAVKASAAVGRNAAAARSRSAGGSGNDGDDGPTTATLPLTAGTETPPAPSASSTLAPPLVTAPPDDDRQRRLTMRVVAFAAALLAVLGVVFLIVGWYATSTYYVGLAGDRVAIYKGRPGGVLWFDPTLKERKDLTVHDVLPSRVADLREGKSEPSKAEADRYVNNLRQEAADLRRQTAATTTVPPPSPEPVPSPTPTSLPAPPLTPP